MLDFFVAAPGAERIERRSELVPIEVWFTPDSVQVFNVGAASCGVPGTPAGLERAAERFGTVPLAELAAPAARLARDGVVVNSEQAYFFAILAPILTNYEEARELYAPGGNLLGEGDLFRFPDLGDALERFGAEGAEPFYTGETAAAMSDWVLERGGTLGRADLAAYAADRPRAGRGEVPRARGADEPAAVLRRHPDRLRAGAARARPGGPATWSRSSARWRRPQSERTEEFLAGLYDEGFAARFLAADRLGSTTHITRSTATGCARASPARTGPARG